MSILTFFPNRTLKSLMFIPKLPTAALIAVIGSPQHERHTHLGWIKIMKESRFWAQHKQSNLPVLPSVSLFLKGGNWCFKHLHLITSCLNEVKSPLLKKSQWENTLTHLICKMKSCPKAAVELEQISKGTYVSADSVLTHCWKPSTICFGAS